MSGLTKHHLWPQRIALRLQTESANAILPSDFKPSGQTEFNLLLLCRGTERQKEFSAESLMRRPAEGRAAERTHEVVCALLLHRACAGAHEAWAVSWSHAPKVGMCSVCVCVCAVIFFHWCDCVILIWSKIWDSKNPQKHTKELILCISVRTPAVYSCGSRLYSGMSDTVGCKEACR